MHKITQLYGKHEAGAASSCPDIQNLEWLPQIQVPGHVWHVSKKGDTNNDKICSTLTTATLVHMFIKQREKPAANKGTTAVLATVWTTEEVRQCAYY